jgi:hypothetical protein
MLQQKSRRAKEQIALLDTYWAEWSPCHPFILSPCQILVERPGIAPGSLRCEGSILLLDDHPTSEHSRSIATYELLRRVGCACALPVCPPHMGGGLGSNQKHLLRMLFRVRPCCESTSRLEPAAGSAPTLLRYERSVPLATLHRQWWRRRDSHPRPSGYEPDALAAAPRRSNGDPEGN